MNDTPPTAQPATTILIIDDVPANLGVAVNYLESRGYRVVIAQEGEEGLQRAAFVKPDLILLDVMLPGDNGFEICRRLKADAATQDIPVIFMTALSGEGAKLAGFDAGGVDFLVKPLRVGEVFARIDMHLKLSRTQMQLQMQNALLHNHRQELESQVAERTAQLLASNRRLTAEIEERKKTEQILQERERQYRTLAEHTSDTIARFDRQCRRIYANCKLIEELGGDEEKVLHRTPSEFPGGPAVEAYQARIENVIAEGRPMNYKLGWQAADGRQIISDVRLTPEFGADGNLVSVLAVGRDISEIDQYRQNIHRLAFYDNLTDLPNRTSLVDRLRQTIADASRYGYRFALMLLDLDRFKEINDTLGHGMGDQLLCVVAERLSQRVRTYDMVARLGGDEFAILMPQLHDGDDIGDLAAEVVKSFELPFPVFGREMFISASLGVALYPRDSADIDALFRCADSAMYHAKQLGRNNFQFYNKELTVKSSERMTLESALRHARANGELALHYQPQVELASGRVIGAEALLRWRREDGSLLAPDKFIAVAESSGLIVGIGDWVLETACRTAVKWNTGRQEPFKMAVNLSTRQFQQHDLLAAVKKVLNETGCKPQWLKLEITESLLLEDSDDVLAVLNAFNEMGLALSIDDFGTGYSALSYLNRFPVSQIKIDRSFVSNIPGAKDKSELVKAMISIAQALNLELVAEGVETREQADYLQRHGCPVGQGYLFGKPMPLEIFEAWLARG